MQEYPAGGFPRQRSFVERMIGAALLDVSVYEEVEHDRSATGQAAGVVAIVAVCAAIGSWGSGDTKGPIAAIVSALLGWVIMAALTYVIGTKVFGGTADMGEMLRTLGFSRAPGVIAAIGFIPLLGWIALFAAWVWQLVTAVVAIRQALDFDTPKAVATAILAWLVVMAVTFGIMMMFGAAMVVGGALTR
ncbi:MAG TPA: Yip1 family protein [Longimicrobium sp.]|nr:Yip1 family protein [Longimicrobium sp.]